MRKWGLAGLLPLLAACVDGTGAPTGTGAPGIASGPVEYLVLNGRMSFEDCKARGGLIITDPGGAMVACDPTVKAPVVLEQENI